VLVEDGVVTVVPPHCKECEKVITLYLHSDTESKIRYLIRITSEYRFSLLNHMMFVQEISCKSIRFSHILGSHYALALCYVFKKRTILTQ